MPPVDILRIVISWRAHGNRVSPWNFGTYGAARERAMYFSYLLNDYLLNNYYFLFKFRLASFRGR